MDQAISVFFNGIIGVFAGMAVLYVMIRLMSLIVDRQDHNPEQGKH